MFPVGTVPRLILYSHVAVAIFATAYSQEWHFAGNNLALHNAMRTEQGPGTYRDFRSNRATDDNTNPNPKKGSCAHTSLSFNPYWSVIVDNLYILKGIRIYNRNIECTEYNKRERLRNFQVIGYPNLTVLHDDKRAVPMLYANDVIEIPVYSADSFSNITVEIPTNETKTWLTLCEVQVFSVKNDCPAIQSDGILLWNIQYGTGYVNPEKKLVSSGAVIDFLCLRNYYIVGKDSITCLSNGSYSENKPTCKVKKNCPEIQSDEIVMSNIRNGTGNVDTEKGLVPSGTVIEFLCQVNYSLIGKDSIICLPSGRYDEDIPTCIVKKDCPVIQSDGSLVWNIRNGTGNVDTKKGLISSGTVIDIWCHLNYYLVQKGSIICLMNGRYNKNTPTCKDADKTESAEHLSFAPVAIGGVAVGVFVIGVAVGLLATVVIYKRKTRTQTQQQTTRDSTYFTQTETGMDETNNYTELNVQSEEPGYMNV